MQPVLDFLQSHAVLMGMLVMAVIDAVVSAHPGIPADNVLGLIKSAIQALIAGKPAQ